MKTTIYRPFGAFRFFLAMLVLCQHSLHSLPQDARAFFYHAELGIVAVAVFFTISGFIVAEANNSFYRDRPGPFMVNRLLRLVPPYLAALAVAVIVQIWLYTAGHFQPWDGPLKGTPWQPLLLLSGVLDIVPMFQPRYLDHQDYTFIGFAWTLRVEFMFYIFAFATYWFLSRKASARQKSWIAGIAFAIAYALFFASLMSEKVPRQFLDAPFFIFGVCLYRLWREKNLFNALHLAAAGACVLASFPHWQQRGAPVLAEQYPILIALLFVFLLLAFIPRVTDRWKAFDKRLGDLSYPLYLNHITVLFLISNLGSDHLGWELYIVGVLASILLAILMFWIVETPLKALRDRVRGAVL